MMRFYHRFKPLQEADRFNIVCERRVRRYSSQSRFHTTACRVMRLSWSFSRFPWLTRFDLEIMTLTLVILNESMTFHSALM